LSEAVRLAEHGTCDQANERTGRPKDERRRHAGFNAIVKVVV
jgi:hypothetical protein